MEYNVIVFGKTEEKAKLQLVKLIQELGDEVLTYNQKYFMTKNAEFRIFPADTGILGARADYIYVDEEISVGLYNLCLLPTVCNSKVPMEERVKFF